MSLGKINVIKKQLELVTTFSKDIGMDFGQDKCAYITIAKGKLLPTTKELKMNGLTIKPIEEGESYRYLGRDENISYGGQVNKERVRNEYFKRVKKIWFSELSGFNKSVAHNSFAVPILTPTFGILDWTIAEIQAIDIKTRKLLCLSGNFHPNSDVDRLYLTRKNNGRGLRSVQVAFECRIVSLHNHIEKIKNRNPIIQVIYHHENNGIIRVGRELLERFNITNDNLDISPRDISQKYLIQTRKEKERLYKEKVMHGYNRRVLEMDVKIDQEKSLSWPQDKYITSHFEGYAFSIQEQDIPTKYLINKRDRDSGKEISCNSKCRLCKNATEDVTHIISSCPEMSSRFYLPLRHDAVAKVVYRHHIQKQNNSIKIRENYQPEFIKKGGAFEYWWNISIKTSTKIPHNKPDLLIWDNQKFVCSIVEFSCPADINVTKKENEKMNIYGPLIRNMQMMYPKYKFKMIPVVIGTLGYVSKHLRDHLEKLGFTNIESRRLIRKLQVTSIGGTVKICKTFLNFSIK